jgi:hypothetical protein
VEVRFIVYASTLPRIRRLEDGGGARLAGTIPAAAPAIPLANPSRRSAAAGPAGAEGAIITEGLPGRYMPLLSELNNRDVKADNLSSWRYFMVFRERTSLSTRQSARKRRRARRQKQVQKFLAGNGSVSSLVVPSFASARRQNRSTFVLLLTVKLLYPIDHYQEREGT